MTVSRLLAALLLLTSAGSASAVTLPIQIDGFFDDWNASAQLEQDGTGDQGSSGIDFTELSAANDQDWLYLRFDTGVEVQPDEQQNMVLYIDTDLNSGTGEPIGGMGADLVWRLGQRNGEFRGSNIDHPEIGLRVGATVSDTQFELAIDRNASISGTPVFTASTIRIVLQDEDGSGDRIPQSGNTIYNLAAGQQAVPTISLGKQNADHVRVVAYNIEGDGLFAGGSREAAIERVFDAVAADIWIINEVWNHDANEVATLVESIHPSGTGGWNAVKRDGGNVVVSRYPILDSWEIFPGNRLTGVLVDLRPQQDTDLLVIANHWSCCTADGARQNQADALIEFMRDARTPGGTITLANDTPIVAGGDFNLVGLRRQLETLLTGDILSNGTFGPDSPPDWDGSDFDQTAPRHNDERVIYTWRRDTSSFYPGKLDYVLYTGSVLDLHNSFVLDTRTMTSASLSAAGLNFSDSELASDHVPVVADFALPFTTSSPPPREVGRARLAPPHPNPFNPATTLTYQLESRGEIDLAIFDSRGRRIASLDRGPRDQGEYRVSWDGRDDQGDLVPSGAYRAQLRASDDTGTLVRSQPLVLVK